MSYTHKEMPARLWSSVEQTDIDGFYPGLQARVPMRSRGSIQFGFLAPRSDGKAARLAFDCAVRYALPSGMPTRLWCAVEQVEPTDIDGFSLGSPARAPIRWQCCQVGIPLHSWRCHRGSCVMPISMCRYHVTMACAEESRVDLTSSTPCSFCRNVVFHF